ncbi:MAG: hypothetical protein U1C04_03150 [Hydrogenophaga sp.]|uniref:hypothetical protein n=1 Tax=Hydrogenophaga sp. TaxID=1904254 RepID=UPI002AB89E20|nr:hypothetical protein [Hydrogenophaga sp.]MDZ4279753.1 hypothetical protein [Hydrogenophaga sp.]
MGIVVVIEDELGKAVSSIVDEKNVLHRILPSIDDHNFFLLNRIDWYGDTTFNRYQVIDIQSELKRLEERENGEKELAMIRLLIDLSQQCLESPHLYLKFYGD